MGTIFLSLRFLFHGLFVESLVNFGERNREKKADENNDFLFFFYVANFACSFMIFFFVSVSLRIKGSSLIPSSNVSLFEEEQKMKS